MVLSTGVETEKGSAKILGLIPKLPAMYGVTKDKDAPGSSKA